MTATFGRILAGIRIGSRRSPAQLAGPGRRSRHEVETFGPLEPALHRRRDRDHGISALRDRSRHNRGAGQLADPADDGGDVEPAGGLRRPRVRGPAGVRRTGRVYGPGARPERPVALRRHSARCRRVRGPCPADLVARLPAPRRLLRHRHLGRGGRPGDRHQPRPAIGRRDRRGTARPLRHRSGLDHRVHVLGGAPRRRRRGWDDVSGAAQQDRPGSHRHPRQRGWRRQRGGPGRSDQAHRLHPLRRRNRRRGSARRGKPAECPGRLGLQRPVVRVHDLRRHHRRPRLDRGSDPRRHRLLLAAAGPVPVRGLVPDRARDDRDGGRAVAAARPLGRDLRPPPLLILQHRLLALAEDGRRVAGRRVRPTPATLGRPWLAESK